MLTTLYLAQSSNAAPVAAFGGVFLIIMIVAIVASLFWLWMLIDCLSSSMPTNEKILWILVIFFLHLVGALIYFVIARGKRA